VWPYHRGLLVGLRRRAADRARRGEPWGLVRGRDQSLVDRPLSPVPAGRRRPV